MTINENSFVRILKHKSVAQNRRERSEIKVALSRAFVATRYLPVRILIMEILLDYE